MGARISVGEIVRTFSNTFQAIDIGCAAILEGETWTNVLTVVRLSYEEPAAVQARLCELEKRYTPVHTKHFFVVRDVRSFPDWEAFCRDAGGGILRVGNVEVKLRQPISLEDLASEPRLSHWDLRPFDGYKWPGVHATVGTVNTTRLLDESLLREVGPLGYSYLHEAINDLCEVNVSNQNAGQEFYVSAPVFASLADVRLLPFEKRIEVVRRRHRDACGFKAAVFFREQNYQMGESSRARRELTTFTIVQEGKTLVTERASADIPEIPRDTWVEVRLVHSVLGQIQQVMQVARTLIPAVERNVLLEAVKRFCPEAELHEILVHPHAKKSKKLNESAAFELRVGWLLGLCGVLTIVLGEYERLLAPETKVLRGSVDILASQAHSDALLLVACTMGPPKEEDFANLLNMRGILEREVFPEAAVRIVPVVFTAAAESPTYREVDDGFGFIPIVNADGIDTLLALLNAGQEVRFFEFLNNPRLSQLRKPG